MRKIPACDADEMAPATCDAADKDLVAGLVNRHPWVLPFVIAFIIYL
jgi:hypothetical protein